MSELLDTKLNRGVMFRSFSHGVREDGLTSNTDEQLMVIKEEELPIDRIRLVAPPELEQFLPHTLPVSRWPLTLRVIRGERQTIPWPDPDSKPPTITLQAGEVVELIRGE